MQKLQRTVGVTRCLLIHQLDVNNDITRFVMSGALNDVKVMRVSYWSGFHANFFAAGLLDEGTLLTRKWRQKNKLKVPHNTPCPISDTSTMLDAFRYTHNAYELAIIYSNMN